MIYYMKVKVNVSPDHRWVTSVISKRLQVTMKSNNQDV